jgi:hypothetical protein
MLLMPRALKLLAILALLVVLPLRAVAGVTIGFCVSGHNNGMAAVAQASHGQHADVRHGDEGPVQPMQSICNICAEHCSSAAFALPAEPAADAWVSGRARTVHAEHGSPLHVPDQLDRPPLA